MDQRREMPRRLGPVLLVVVVIAALVGVFAGDGFGEGDTSGAVKERGGEERGEPWWRDIVDVVSAFAVIVIGVATVWVMIQQHRQAKRQAVWEKTFGERQLKQERELREREEWVTRGRVREGALELAIDYLGKAWSQGELTNKDRAEYLAGVIAKGGVFEGEGVKLLMSELEEKVTAGRKVMQAMGRERVRGGGKRPEEMERLSKELREITQWVGGALAKLGEACWKKRGDGGCRD